MTLYHGDYKKRLKKAERDDLARGLQRLVHLNQSKVHLLFVFRNFERRKSGVFLI